MRGPKICDIECFTGSLVAKWTLLDNGKGDRSVDHVMLLAGAIPAAVMVLLIERGFRMTTKFAPQLPRRDGPLCAGSGNDRRVRVEIDTAAASTGGCRRAHRPR